jgi:hypothetical protein
MPDEPANGDCRERRNALEQRFQKIEQTQGNIVTEITGVQVNMARRDDMMRELTMIGRIMGGIEKKLDQQTILQALLGISIVLIVLLIAGLYARTA